MASNKYSMPCETSWNCSAFIPDVWLAKLFKLGANFAKSSPNAWRELFPVNIAVQLVKPFITSAAVKDIIAIARFFIPEETPSSICFAPVINVCKDVINIDKSSPNFGSESAIPVLKAPTKSPNTFPNPVAIKSNKFIPFITPSDIPDILPSNQNTPAPPAPKIKRTPSRAAAPINAASDKGPNKAKTPNVIVICFIAAVKATILSVLFPARFAAYAIAIIIPAKDPATTNIAGIAKFAGAANVDTSNIPAITVPIKDTIWPIAYIVLGSVPDAILEAYASANINPAKDAVATNIAGIAKFAGAAKSEAINIPAITVPIKDTIWPIAYIDFESVPDANLAASPKASIKPAKDAAIVIIVGIAALAVAEMPDIAISPIITVPINATILPIA